MTEHDTDTVDKRDLVMYMDVLGHDILNNNQAVIGYLELIQASADRPQKVREYSLKAVSHVRSATLLLDNVRKVVEAGYPTGAAAPSRVDLESTLERVKNELTTLFPERSIAIAAELRGVTPVAAEGIVYSLALSLMVDLVRLDEKKDVKLEVSASMRELEGEKGWTLRFVRRGSPGPMFLREGFLRSIGDMDKSKTVKTTGAIFATLVTRQMGGELKAMEVKGPGSERGLAFEVTFAGGEGP